MTSINKITVFVLSFLLIGSFSAAAAQNGKGAEMSAEHKSKVEAVVQDLKGLAGKDKNIGEEISAVAKEQEESGQRAVEAMKKVEARSGFKTFFIGTDYKNIGALRSEIVTTKNQINRLKKVGERATTTEVKAELDTQIKALENAYKKATDFIQTNENKFSLFGWVAKLFNK